MHADDATLIASTRDLAISKLRSLLQYCKINAIIPQYTKCEFIVINGTLNDCDPLPFGEKKLLKNVQYTGLLGSHLSSKGTVAEDLKLHMVERYKSCIKFFNFLRANQLAPLSVKLKVMKSCVVNSVLHNCETFGGKIPTTLEKTYNKLLKCTLGVRVNTPTLTLYIESGFLPIRAVIIARQWKFYTRYKEGLMRRSPKVDLFNRLLSEPTDFLQHYIDITSKYNSVEDIYKEFKEEVQRKIRELARKEKTGYKYKIYEELNPDLKVSPFIHNFHPLCRDIIRFRLGSHSLPIETGRWTRTRRENRLCSDCGVLGDERHAIYQCSNVDRTDISLPEVLSEIWSEECIYVLFKRLKEAKILD